MNVCKNCHRPIDGCGDFCSYNCQKQYEENQWRNQVRDQELQRHNAEMEQKAYEQAYWAEQQVEAQRQQAEFEQQKLYEQREFNSRMEQENRNRTDAKGLVSYFEFYKNHPIPPEDFPDVRNAYNKALEYINGNYDFQIKAYALQLKDLLNQIQSKYDEAKRQYQPIQDKLDIEAKIQEYRNQIQNLEYEIENTECKLQASLEDKQFSYYYSKDNETLSFEGSCSVNIDIINERGSLSIGKISNDAFFRKNVSIKLSFLDEENLSKYLNHNRFYSKDIYNDHFSLKGGYYIHDYTREFKFYPIDYSDYYLVLMLLEDNKVTSFLNFGKNTELKPEDEIRLPYENEIDELQNQIDIIESKISELENLENSIKEDTSNNKRTFDKPTPEKENDIQDSKKQKTTEQKRNSEKKSTNTTNCGYSNLKIKGDPTFIFSKETNQVRIQIDGIENLSDKSSNLLKIKFFFLGKKNDEVTISEYTGGDIFGAEISSFTVDSIKSHGGKKLDRVENIKFSPPKGIYRPLIIIEELDSTGNYKAVKWYNFKYTINW